MGTRQKSPTPTDAQLTAAVHDALAADRRLAPSEVTVHVQQGEVTLHGLVPSYYQKHIAAQAAHDVVGVTGVTNGLAVRTAQRDDADIQADVQLQLNTDVLLAPGSLGVRSHHGIVTLTQPQLVAFIIGAALGVLIGWIVSRVSIPRLDSLRQLKPPARLVAEPSAALPLVGGVVGCLVLLLIVGLIMVKRTRVMEVMRGTA